MTIISAGPTDDGYSGTLTISPGVFTATLTAPPGLASGSSVVSTQDKIAGVGSYVPASFSAATAPAAVNGAAILLASSVGLWPGDRRILSIRKQLLVAYNASVGVNVGAGFAPVAPVNTFSPAQLPGLTAWYNSQQGVITAGSLVTNLTDLSDNGFNLAAAGGARPTYSNSGLNGFPKITFTGANVLTETTVNMFASGAARTVIAAVQLSSTTGGAICAFRTGGGGNICELMWSLISASNYVYSDGVTDANNQTTTGATNTSPAILSYIYQTGQLIQFAINGVGESVVPVGGGSCSADNAVGTGFALGNNPADSNLQPLNGDFYEIIICSGVLSSANLVLAQNYLASKYG